jgi:hypothetical protein
LPLLPLDEGPPMPPVELLDNPHKPLSWTAVVAMISAAVLLVRLVEWLT